MEKMLNYIISYKLFHYFAQNTRKTNWPIVAQFGLFAFFIGSRYISINPIMWQFLQFKGSIKYKFQGVSYFGGITFKHSKTQNSNTHLCLKWTGMAYWQFFDRLETIPPLWSDDCHIHRNSFVAIKCVFWAQNITHMRLRQGLYFEPCCSGSTLISTLRLTVVNTNIPNST